VLEPIVVTFVVDWVMLVAPSTVIVGLPDPMMLAELPARQDWKVSVPLAVKPPLVVKVLAPPVPLPREQQF